MPPRAVGTRGQVPPRGAQGGGRGDRGGHRGRGRGGEPGGGDRGRRGRGGTPASLGGMHAGGRDDRPSIADHVQGIGVKRTLTGFGTSGRAIRVRIMNSFEVTLFQYDVVTTPNDCSKRFNMRIMDKVQADEPNIFTSPILYDGRSIMLSKQRLPLGNTDSREFNVVFGGATGRRSPDVYQLKLTKVDAEVNLHTLQEFTGGRYSQDNPIQMAEMVLNIAIRMLCIPPPVYYADAKRAIHFNSTHNPGSGAASQASGSASPTLEDYKNPWLPIDNARQSSAMYWM